MTHDPTHRCQLLTPPGAGAIAVVRVTGPDPARLVDSVFEPAGGRALYESAASRPLYGQVTESGEVIDDVLAYSVRRAEWAAVEICCHGGIRVVERILETLASAGASLHPADNPVWPSTTMIEREALDLLLHTETRDGVRLLAWQRQNTPHWLVETATYCAGEKDEARGRMAAFVARSQSAMRIISGATIALIGPPNAGKSTLFNRLVGRDAAIVASAAGTTRDWVSASIELGGMLVTLIDTAGLRVEASDLERIAIETGRQKASTTDLSLFVIDGTTSRSTRMDEPLCELPPARSILVRNKCDIMRDEHVNRDVISTATLAGDSICVSGRTGEGIAELIKLIEDRLTVNPETLISPSAFTSRQRRVGLKILDLIDGGEPSAAASIKGELTGISG